MIDQIVQHMKRSIPFFITISCILLVGCFETTQEVTINKNGTGMFSNTTDLSNLIGLLKQMGGDEAGKLQNTDTTISLTGVADSIAGLTTEQKRIVNKGTMKLKLNMEDEKLVVKLDFPFEKLSDVELLKDLANVVRIGSEKITWW